MSAQFGFVRREPAACWSDSSFFP